MNQQTILIIGHTTHESVKIWCRSTSNFECRRLELIRNSDVINEVKIDLKYNIESSNIVCHTFQNLDPNTEYTIKLIESDSNTFSGRLTTFPNPNEEKSFKFMFSSCLLYNSHFFGKKELIFQNLKRISEKNKTAFSIFCGDQIYIDTISSTTPKNPDYQTYRKKYDECWSLPGAAQFYAQNNCYMILDDHELANEYDNAFEHLNQNKIVGLKAYNDFQHLHNPDTKNDTYYYNFEYGKVKFFVLDLRTERDSSIGQMISDEQQLALFSWLNEFKDELKIIVSPVPFVIQVRKYILKDVYGHKDKWSGDKFKSAYFAIINKLISSKSNKLFFITGDVHSAVQGKLTALDKTGEKYEWHEFMAGPLNQFLVNGNIAFEKNIKITNQNQLTGPFELNYSRESINNQYRNACVVSVNFSNGNYEIIAEWFRAQHKSKVVSILKSKKVLIPC